LRKSKVSGKAGMRSTSAAAVLRWSVEALEARTLLSVGSPDPTFGQGGQVTVQFPGPAVLTSVRDSAVQADGKVVIAGRAADAAGGAGASDFAIARLNADGSVDTTFGAGGVAVVHSDGNNDSAESVAVQPDGKIVAVGYFGNEASGQSPTDEQFVVARFNADGTVDTSFGGSGVLTPSFGANGATPRNAEGHAVLLRSDGEILAAGYSATGPSGATQSALALYRADGTLDPAFGSGGLVAQNVTGGPESVFDIAFQADGKVVAVGTPTSPDVGTPAFLVERFNADGSVDQAFGTNGAAVSVFSGAATAAANSIAMEDNGRIVLGGYVVSGNLQSTNSADVIYNFGLARFNSSGTPDNRFGRRGQVLGSPQHLQSGFQGYEVIDRVVPEPGGGIIVSGLHAANTGDASTGQLNAMVAGYEENGRPDLGFGENGQMILGPFGTGSGSARTLAPADRVAAAAGTEPEQFRDIQRKDAAIVAALNDRLILVSSASDQITARRLIGDGPDVALDTPLVGVKRTSVLGGSKAIAGVPVTSEGSDTFDGQATITLLLSTDQTIDSADATVTTLNQTLHIKPGATRTVKVKFNYPTDLPDGSYSLLARIDPASGTETDASNNTTGAPQAITVAKPFIDLTGSFTLPSGAAGPLTPGGRAVLPVSLQNSGNIPAKGPVSFTFLASTDMTHDAGDTTLGSPRAVTVGLKPGGSRRLKLVALVPAGLAAGSYFLIATMDAPSLNESDLQNNDIIATSPVQVA
jgi:uncharacterized delta-60 repeat protein